MKKFLIVSTTGLGDTLFGTPAIRALRKSFPDAEIDVLLHKRRQDLLKFNPHVNTIYLYRNSALIKLLLVLRLRRKFYDRILIFHTLKNVLSLLKRLNYGEILTYQNIEHPDCKIKRLCLNGGLHSIIRRIKLVEEIGGKPDGVEMELHFSGAHQKTAEEFIIPSKGEENLIGVHIGAAEPQKCWPIENFAAVIDFIRKKYDADIFISGVPSERPLYEALGEKIDISNIPFTGRLDILESAALIARCKLFISNDTGPLHMALALGVPTVSFFCPTNPDTVGPIIRDTRNVIIRKNIPCEVCVMRECKDPFCMAEISVEETLEAVEKNLNHPPARLTL